MYGDYAHEIAEGRAADLEASGGMAYIADNHDNELTADVNTDATAQMNVNPDLLGDTETAEKSDETQIPSDTTHPKTTYVDDLNDVYPLETTFEKLSKESVFLVNGDSNSNWIHFRDPASNIDDLLLKAETEAGNKKEQWEQMM